MRRLILVLARVGVSSVTVQRRVSPASMLHRAYQRDECDQSVDGQRFSVGVLRRRCPTHVVNHVDEGLASRHRIFVEPLQVATERGDEFFLQPSPDQIFRVVLGDLDARMQLVFVVVQTPCIAATVLKALSISCWVARPPVALLVKWRACVAATFGSMFPNPAVTFGGLAVSRYMCGTKPSHFWTSRQRTRSRVSVA